MEHLVFIDRIIDLIIKSLKGGQNCGIQSFIDKKILLRAQELVMYDNLFEKLGKVFGSSSFLFPPLKPRDLNFGIYNRVCAWDVCYSESEIGVAWPTHPCRTS